MKQLVGVLTFEKSSDVALTVLRESIQKAQDVDDYLLFYDLVVMDFELVNIDEFIEAVQTLYSPLIQRFMPIFIAMSI